MDQTRVDRWLWSVRLCPTRSAATAACQGGHVTVNGAAAKPATKVQAGDRVEAYLAGRRREVEVVRVIDKRVGAPIAVGCFVDHSPPPEVTPASPPVFARERGAGRPTKKDRRQLQRLRDPR